MLRSIAARASTDASTDSGRCDASRSMRATSIARPHPSRGAHARSTLRERLRMRAPQDEDEDPGLHSSRCQTAHLVPAAHFCVRGLRLCFAHPASRGGRSTERRSGACEAPFGHALGASQDARERACDATRQALARRLASHDAGRSPLGAPPWRFFTRGRASFSGIASGSVQRAPRSQVVVPGGRGPGPPGASGYEPPAAGRHAPLRLQDRLRRRPSMSKAANLIFQLQSVVKN